MNKYIIAFIFCLFSFTAYAQTKHIKFMGFPIDGTISSFEQKLLSKGLKQNKLYNQVSPVGERFYDGIFAGYDAQFVIRYNTKTKIVYNVTVLIKRQDMSYVNMLYHEFINLYMRKYKDWEGGINEENTVCKLWNNDGYIVLSPSSESLTALLIMYNDNVNEEKNKQVENSDL